MILKGSGQCHPILGRITTAFSKWTARSARSTQKSTTSARSRGPARSTPAQYYESVYNYGTLTPGTASVPGILTANNIYLYSGGNFNVLLNGDTALPEPTMTNWT